MSQQWFQREAGEEKRLNLALVRQETDISYKYVNDAGPFLLRKSRVRDLRTRGTQGECTFLPEQLVFFT